MLKAEGIVKVGNAIIAAYPPLVPLKNSRVTALAIYYSLTDARSSALTPHDGHITALVANDKFFASAGTDRTVNVYDIAGESKASLLAEDIPVGLEFDGNKLLIVRNYSVAISTNGRE
jgi:hypothetical protein